MVPKLHKKGRSFRGAAQYLLHDKGADTSERVAWHETRNLFTDNPHFAWRIMAATAMDQARLKQEAGVKSTGRKSDLHVQHMTLSWHEHEADSLDRDAMLAAADSALVSLGAQDRQAMIVCHDDEPHPHVHILLNRVSPDDGRILSSSKEKLKLSEWAEAYEKERGRIWCDERVVNNAARRRGEYTRGVPSRARHLYEAEQHQPVNNNTAKEIRDEQKRKDAKLSEITRQTQARHAEAWVKLEQQHKQRVQDIRQDTKRSVLRKIGQVREAYRPKWTELHQEQQATMIAFEQRETTLLGRVRNRFKAIDLPRLVKGEKKQQAIGEAFNAMTTKTGRLEALQRQHRQAEKALLREQRLAEEAGVANLQEQAQKQLADNRLRFQAERAQVALDQRMELAKLRSQWLERHKARKRALHAPELGKALQHDRQQSQARPGDLLPKQGAQSAAKMMNEHQKRLLRKSQRDARRKRGRPDERGR
ncbi:MAG: relaxase/mobilization nuclease domain-containing protein [Planctomycetota bacterium]